MSSVWRNQTLLPAFPKLDNSIKTDVAVIGGGMAGILCAHSLMENGVKCVLIEADRICHGVTGNTTAKITAQHGCVYSGLVSRFGEQFARMYYEANHNALQKYRELSRRIDCDFEDADSCVYSMGDNTTLKREYAAMRRIGIGDAEYIDENHLPFATTGMIRLLNQAQFSPLKLVEGLIEKMRIYEHTRFCALEGRAIVTERGRISADKIIIATHFPVIDRYGLYFLKMYQHRSYVIAFENAEFPSGMYIRDSGDGLSFRKHGELLLVGGGGHRTGKVGGGWEELTEFANRYFPKAKERFRWATQDCMTLDSVPYIGRYSEKTPWLYVTTGFNKWGMTSSMVGAMLLTDMIVGKENRYERIFSPSRSVFRPQLFKNILESSLNMVRISKPRCPHLGCALRWNDRERSWDCPCHGSRFSQSGQLLDSPANVDLDEF